MKFAGAAGLITAGTLIGFYLSDNSKNKVLICRELALLCDYLSGDIRFKGTPVPELLDSLLAGDTFRHLSFLSVEGIKHYHMVSSPLTNDENREITEFLYSLGKYDAAAQVNLISQFKEYIKTSEIKYREKHAASSKIYLSLGFLSGAVISLVLI